jgi:DNA-binding response OmpR family regulator
MKILIIDSNIDCLGMIENHIKQWNINNFNNSKIITSYNGKDGLLHLLKEQDIDIVFVGMAMEFMDGIETIILIKNLLLKKEPIIISTSTEKNDVLDSIARNRGADMNIIKPFKYNMLEAIINKLLSPEDIKNNSSQVESTLNQIIISESKNIILSNKKAKKLIKDNKCLVKYILEDFINLKEDAFLLSEKLTDKNLLVLLDDVIQLLKEYSETLDGLSEIHKFSKILNHLANKLSDIDVSYLQEHSTEVIEYIKLILNIIDNWIEDVLIKENLEETESLNNLFLDINIKFEKLLYGI